MSEEKDDAKFLEQVIGAKVVPANLYDLHRMHEVMRAEILRLREVEILYLREEAAKERWVQSCSEGSSPSPLA